MKRIGDYHVRLDDGTIWSFDRATEDLHSLEWIQRYGTPDAVVQQRLTVASILASYKALIEAPAKRRNEVVRAIRVTLAPPQSGTSHGEGNG